MPRIMEAMGYAIVVPVKDSGMQRRGTTILELTVAVAIMVTVFAAVMPLFAGIRRSAETHWAGLEMLQNARTLNEYLGRNLATAHRIVAVSGTADRNGYIAFERRDGQACRLEVGSEDRILAGPVEELRELVGPVEYLRFACYEGTDSGEPTCATNAIRLVTWEAGLFAPAASIEGRVVRGACWLRIGGGVPRRCAVGQDDEEI